jgi:hypothetical protein
MSKIDGQSNSQLAENGQPDDGLSQDNPSLAAEIVRRSQEAMARQRRAWEDWMAIAETLQVGRADAMQKVHTNQPTRKRYEKAMAEWLIAHSFHVIDKGARNRLLECLQHRNEIEKWRSHLTDAERFRFNHPNTVNSSITSPRIRHGIAPFDDTVLSIQIDPYRLDAPSGHDAGRWAPAQLAKGFGKTRCTHWRGLHYSIVARGNVRKQDGSIFRNTEEDWLWLSTVAREMIDTEVESDT